MIPFSAQNVKQDAWILFERLFTHFPGNMVDMHKSANFRRFRTGYFPSTHVPIWKKPGHQPGFFLSYAPYWTRTNGLLLRRQLLYPAELKAHLFVLNTVNSNSIPQIAENVKRKSKNWHFDEIRIKL